MATLFKIQNDTLTAALDKLDSKTKDFTPLTKLIAGDLMDAVEENFKQQGIPRWKPLAPSTIKQRKRKGYWPGRILQQTGQLASSISSAFNANSAMVGTNKVYAAIHQFGGEIHQAARSNLYKMLRYKKTTTKHKKGQFKKIGTEHGGFSFGTRTIIIPARPYLNPSDKYIADIARKIIYYALDL